MRPDEAVNEAAGPRSRIVVVEDDRNIALSLETTLRREGYDVSVARTAAAGMELCRDRSPDLVLLDWMLPDGDGLEVLQAIRGLGETPVLFLTARDAVADKVLGLELGADDYLTKPFHADELMARIRSLLRRSRRAPTVQKTLTQGPLEVLLEERRVTRSGEILELTRTEFDLLVHLMRNPRIVMSRETLLEAVWGYSFEGYQRTVDAHIRRLRAKLEPVPDEPRFIHTVRGVGYRFELRSSGR